MAKKTNNTPESGVNANSGSFTKGLVRDFDENFDPESSWPYARNASNNSREGDVGLLGNEPSNYQCGEAPYTVIGRIHLFDAYWAIFSTDDTESEIGLYDESLCKYRTIVNQRCLNFKRLDLITGASKENFDCQWAVYFADGRNLDRYINIGNPDLWPDIPYIGNNYYQGNVLWPGVPWNQDCKLVNACTVCTDINTLDCDKIRINKIVSTPCIKVDNSAAGGNLSNGSYFAVIAYTMGGQKYGDYTSPSNVQYIFNHAVIGGSLDITITNLELEAFTEFELVVVATVNQATIARKIGVYNTSASITITLDNIDDSLVTVPLELIPIRTPLYETSDSIFETGNYLLKIGPRTTFDFNYQPIANQIKSNWVISAYPADYYKKGGYVTGYMRDEVYSFFIRWIYNTGEKSKSFHIPGREPLAGETASVGAGSLYGLTDPELYFEANNTASIDVLLPVGDTVEDGGVVIARGTMAYWESTEKYPDRMPDVWGDLCNKPIRHHKMPEDIIGLNTTFTRSSGSSGTNLSTTINILGVEFSNIKPPLDNDGNIISGIVGYEILRGSRKGNKSIVAKGIINNMRGYETPSGNNGLYQNFPYNPIVPQYGAEGLDPSLSLESVPPDDSPYVPLTESSISKKYFTFHSPDTSFYKPFLSAKELRLYTEVGSANNVNGQFQEVNGHPKEKLLTDFALIVSLVIGAAEAAAAMKGKTTTMVEGQRVLNLGFFGATAGPLAGVFQAPSAAALVSTGTASQIAAAEIALNAALEAAEALNSIGTGPSAANTLYNSLALLDQSLRGFIGRGKTYEQEEGKLKSIPGLGTLAGIATFGNFTNIAAEKNIELIYSLVKFTQYALQYVSHGVLHKDSLGNATGLNKRRRIEDSGYLSNQFNTFDNYTVNNLYRSSTVILKINNNLSNPALTDNSICTVGTNNTGVIDLQNPFEQFKSTASCYYAGLKLRYRNQYGQLDSIEQIPLKCPVIINDNKPIQSPAVVFKSPVLFGGDTYISRYTEKNTFFYFLDWLYNVPDGTSFNYSSRFLGLYPRYYANFEKYDVTGLLSSVFSNLSDPDQWDTPANFNNLDDTNSNDSWINSINFKFGKKDSFFYLFQSGVRDFYVESDLNVAQRDWGELDQEKHYEILSNLSELFDTRIIKFGNYFKLDPSVSINNISLLSVISWGNIQDRDYNPQVASFCYQYLPNRVIYSLPAILEAKKDGWRIFLPNNYRDFKSKVIAIRPIGKNGALMLFERDSPVQIQGTETLESDTGTKITVGDGALFNKPLQALINTDQSYEYGSCQDKFSILNTPMGIYWISQSLGKIFTVGNGLDEISADGMRWWFSKFLPYRILEDFPNFEATDNPVVGVGCQAVYDNNFLMVYFTKKDYELRKDLPENFEVIYNGGIDFILTTKSAAANGSRDGLKIKLGDPNYFTDVSWTVSYDPKNKSWISFHDWHPTLMIPSNQNFITVNDNTFWRHNDRTDSYCNYYGVDYPFQVEYVVDSGQTVNTLKSIEYLLESYVYDIDGIDRFQLLDFNFDELVVYNSEQVSGLLNLNLAPKENPFARLTYPNVTPTGINIIFDKVEQKFRVNQFWDVTADRGEYNVNVQRPIWLTGWDGYKRSLNPANLNYAKSVFERKKFRHYYNNVLFTRKISGNAKMLMKISNNKNLLSPR
jgi:hypothetical protein